MQGQELEGSDTAGNGGYSCNDNRHNIHDDLLSAGPERFSIYLTISDVLDTHLSKGRVIWLSGSELNTCSVFSPARHLYEIVPSVAQVCTL